EIDRLGQPGGQTTAGACLAEPGPLLGSEGNEAQWMVEGFLIGQLSGGDHSGNDPGDAIVGTRVRDAVQMGSGADGRSGSSPGQLRDGVARLVGPHRQSQIGHKLGEDRMGLAFEERIGQSGHSRPVSAFAQPREPTQQIVHDGLRRLRPDRRFRDRRHHRSSSLSELGSPDAVTVETGAERTGRSTAWIWLTRVAPRSAMASLSPWASAAAKTETVRIRSPGWISPLTAPSASTTAIATPVCTDTAVASCASGPSPLMRRSI